MSSATSGTKSVLSDIKSAAKGVQGAGDALRGTVNESVNAAFDDHVGAAKERAVADQGLNAMDRESARMDAKHGTQTSGISTGGVSGTTTGAGAHSGAVGNMQSNPVATPNMPAEPGRTTQRY